MTSAYRTQPLPRPTVTIVQATGLRSKRSLIPCEMWTKARRNSNFPEATNASDCGRQIRLRLISSGWQITSYIKGFHSSDARSHQYWPTLFIFQSGFVSLSAFQRGRELFDPLVMMILIVSNFRDNKQRHFKDTTISIDFFRKFTLRRVISINLSLQLLFVKRRY